MRTDRRLFTIRKPSIIRRLGEAKNYAYRMSRRQTCMSSEFPALNFEQVPNTKWLHRIQLYLDRVHPILPILSPARVIQSRKDTESLDQYGRCLQYAMWTIATAFSSQFEKIRDKLYVTTREMLDKLDFVELDDSTHQVEPTQVWILVVYYEFIKTNYHRGWLSAGRLFRHIQMAELYNVDRATKACTSGIDTDPIIAEEKRRAFWLAYCLDRVISVCETMPLTLGEEVVSSH